MKTKSSRFSPFVRAALRVSALALGGVLFITLATQTEQTASAAPKASLRTPQSFASIADASARSRALFVEAGKVIQHPRCVNCHPSGEQPTQGNGEPHLPAVVRGDDGYGATALRCPTCHQAENYAASGVPGHPKWHTAPLSMAWQGKTL
ncbi:MAG: hypothetical protein JWN04_4335, partial [Myxococcaceae bacterium]|nr:hypothetical protein [Myxococcaceae bacterium]